MTTRYLKIPTLRWNLLTLSSSTHRLRFAVLQPPVFGEVWDIVEERLVLLPLVLPLLRTVLRLAQHDSLQDRLVLLRHSKQLTLALLTIQARQKQKNVWLLEINKIKMHCDIVALRKYNLIVFFLYLQCKNKMFNFFYVCCTRVDHLKITHTICSVI